MALVVKNLPANAGDKRDMGSIPGLGRHGNPLQCSCLENPHGQRSLVGYSPWGRKESDTSERVSTRILSMPRVVPGPAANAFVFA